MEEYSFGTCNAIDNHDVENIEIENFKTENRKMKNVILISVITLIIGLALILSDAVAEQRRITFEMGESGQTVSFPMSPEEIIFADFFKSLADNNKLMAICDVITDLILISELFNLVAIVAKIPGIIPKPGPLIFKIENIINPIMNKMKLIVIIGVNAQSSSAR